MKTEPVFWHRTPPALFPCLLGFLGLGLAWRRAAQIWPVPGWVGEAVLVVACALFVFTFISYILKLIIRPTVIFDDLKVGPARGAVSAGSMCLMLVATAVTPYALEFARQIWWFAVFQHAIYMLCVTLSLTKSKAQLSDVNPSIMLPFVGYIVASIGGPALGYETLSGFFLMVTIPGCIFIIVLSLMNLETSGVIKQLRSSYFIVLAPLSVYGIAAFSIWPTDIFVIFWSIALVCALFLAPFTFWFSEGGWNPGWGAFTFPLAAFSSVMITGVQADLGVIAKVGAVASLSVATLIVPFVVWKTYRFWALGKLAQATGAAVV